MVEQRFCNSIVLIPPNRLAFHLNRFCLLSSTCGSSPVPASFVPFELVRWQSRWQKNEAKRSAETQGAAQYSGRTIVPIDQVCRDFFGHLSVDKLLRKALRGNLALPIVRIETSQKAQWRVHLVDLAAYIDKRRNAAVKEYCQLTGRPTYEFGTTIQAKSATKL